MSDADWVDEDAGDDWVDETPAAPKKKASAGKSFVGGGYQGVTLGFGDELAGLLGKVFVGDGVKLGKGMQIAADDTPEVRAIKEEALRSQADNPTGYQMTRDAVRGALAQARADNPGAYLAGEIVGGTALPVPGGVATQGLSKGAKLLKAMKGGAGLGAAYGLGNSTADLAQGDVAGALADTATGGALGAAGGALAEGVVAPLVGMVGRGVGRARDALVDRADQGISKAKEMAFARARKEGTEELESLTGKLGAETQKGSRMTENIRRIPGEAAEATPEGQAALMRDAARIARERADDMLNQAKAQGLEDVPNSVGEFLTKRSKKDTAQKGRSQAQRLLDGAKQMEDDAERVLRGELSPKALNANLNQARDIAMGSAPFKQLEGTVLSENIRRLPQQVAEIEAARAARDAAARGLEGNTAGRAGELLSGRAATQRLKELGLRYALPLSGAAAGGLLGDEYGWLGKAGGAYAGYKAGGMGNGAIAALAGAGLRPGLQALYRTATQYPAVQNALWRLVRKTGEADVGRLGPRIQAALPAAGRTELAAKQGEALLEALRRKMISRADDEGEGLAGR